MIRLGSIALLVLGCMRLFPDSMDDFSNDWYSKQLRAAGEQRLQRTGSPDREVFRFSWFPSFHPTITVRVERTGDTYRLDAKRLSGDGGYDPGGIAQEVHRPLDAREWAAFQHHVQEASFWSMPSNEPVKFNEEGEEIVGADGSQWLLEGAGESQYHYVDRWFVEDYPSYFSACLCLLKLSGLPLDDLEGYVEDSSPGCT